VFAWYVTDWKSNGAGNYYMQARRGDIYDLSYYPSIDSMASISEVNRSSNAGFRYEQRYATANNNYLMWYRYLTDPEDTAWHLLAETTANPGGYQGTDTSTCSQTLSGPHYWRVDWHRLSLTDSTIALADGGQVVGPVIEFRYYEGSDATHIHTIEYWKFMKNVGLVALTKDKFAGSSVDPTSEIAKANKRIYYRRIWLAALPS
jgi:hypothetical protein